MAEPTASLNTSEHPTQPPSSDTTTPTVLPLPQPASPQPPPPPQDARRPPDGEPAAAAAAAAAELARLTLSLRRALRRYPDFPAPGVLFEDVFPLFRDPARHADLLRALELRVAPLLGGPGTPDVVVGLDARGFVFGPSLALRLGAGFVPVRKPGKLPGRTVQATFRKEYGEDRFEMQADAIRPGQRVLIVDDLVATGGSAYAAGELVEKLGGELLGYVFLLELKFLKARERLRKPVYSLLTSQDEQSDQP